MGVQELRAVPVLVEVEQVRVLGALMQVVVDETRFLACGSTSATSASGSSCLLPGLARMCAMTVSSWGFASVGVVIVDSWRGGRGFEGTEVGIGIVAPGSTGALGFEV